MIKQLLERLGFVATDIGGGERAYEKRYPAGHYVWINDAVGKVDFNEQSGQASLAAYDGQSEPIGEPMEALPDELEAAVLKICQRAFLHACEKMDVDTYITNAIDAAFADVQGNLGVNDGGLAGLFVSGPHEDALKSMFTQYIEAEINQIKSELDLQGPAMASDSYETASCSAVFGVYLFKHVRRMPINDLQPGEALQLCIGGKRWVECPHGLPDVLKQLQENEDDYMEDWGIIASMAGEVLYRASSSASISSVQYLGKSGDVLATEPITIQELGIAQFEPLPGTIPIDGLQGGQQKLVLKLARSTAISIDSSPKTTAWSFADPSGDPESHLIYISWRTSDGRLRDCKLTEGGIANGAFADGCFGCEDSEGDDICIEFFS